jgi:tRNA uridine 5-carbamoylmethylation protein Kti12
MYDNVYEHPECPSDPVIEDDDALEGWMILQKKKNEAAKKQNAFNNSSTSENMKKAGEIFMLANSKEDAESILDMNTQESRSILQEKLSYINKVGTINDGELPDVQRTIQQQINDAKRASKGK